MLVQQYKLPTLNPAMLPSACTDGKLVIANLQKTPLDPVSAMRVWSKTDDLMTRTMAYLGLDIPPFILRRRLVVEVGAPDEDQGGRTQIKVILGGCEWDT